MKKVRAMGIDGSARIVVELARESGVVYVCGIGRYERCGAKKSLFHAVGFPERCISDVASTQTTVEIAAQQQ